MELEWGMLHQPETPETEAVSGANAALKSPFTVCNSTDVSNPFLRLYFSRGNRLCRKLEHRCFLTLQQVSQQHHLPVGKFQRIMMRSRVVLVDLPKDGRRVIDDLHLPAKQPEAAAPYRSGEGKLRPRKNANRRIGILQCSKPAWALKEWVLSFSPTLAGRDLTLCKL
jgi:hypothetical protein